MATSVGGPLAVPIPGTAQPRVFDPTGYAGKPSLSSRKNTCAQSIDDPWEDIIPEHRRPKLSQLAFGSAPDMAGVAAGRMNEIHQHTRKRINPGKGYSDGVRELLYCTSPQGDSVSADFLRGSTGCPAGQTPLYPAVRSSKRSHLRICAGDLADQRKHFQTRWQAIDGKMEFCTCRKGGSASVELDFKQLDRDATYHTWKRMQGAYDRRGRSHLQWDRFLTVEPDAHRSDRLPVVKNRLPPLANPDGPFETRDVKRHPMEVSSLDRTLCPRKGEKTEEDVATGKAPGAASARFQSGHCETSSLKPYPETQPRQLYKRAQYDKLNADDSMYYILRGGACGRASQPSICDEYPAQVPQLGLPAPEQPQLVHEQQAISPQTPQDENRVSPSN
ncbi:hypothetical protein TGME49_286600 [Toxoplasma gondii ME49]|uniref:Uncharacterized protein n=1 Tax=Toxoplasma gondii (strain ATCC 50611 / Me49) TaxID=508771 RepID=S8FBH9_TOXGM|nr:hypothetical protein TGME49_286600 [Toxoplasma gondii ME49]EPT31008.1 hypothetical protein TGME49_286600 [Toxoplasma gondii ME49]|eukprot:XP_018637777.1 hypothetical protein TGME49_286600 [Toxoplasma gondii ME49]